jgi:hypothetical protein
MSRDTLALLLVVATACTGEVKPSSQTGETSVTATEDTPPTPTGTTPTTEDPTTTPTTSTPTTPTDTATTGTTGTTLPEGLYGQPPATPLGLPSFAGVLDMYGSPVTNAGLVGQPTVMWFYPAAFTGG